MISPRRTMISYHGGKWMLAPWIIKHLPPHRIYVEPFGGGGSVLLRKQRSYSEVYNDLDGEIVNLFRMVRDRGEELRQLLRDTPYSREEFKLSFEVVDDSMEMARRTVVRSFQGFGSNSLCRAVCSGFRSNSNRSGSTHAHDWMRYPDAMGSFIERLRGVVIENRDALEVIGTHDRADVLHYVDPPYVHSTRSLMQQNNKKGYSFEMSDDQHRTLSELLHDVKGMVVLSGYESPLYAELYGEWHSVSKSSYADGARERTERLWLNPAAAKFINTDLFHHSEGASA